MFSNEHPVSAKFLAACRERCRLQGGRVLVALSGGPDSVALVHLLLVYRDRLGIEPIVAHIDHKLRRDSAADADFCRDLAEKWGLAFHVRAIETGSYARTHKLSLETAARELRYQALRAIAQETGAADIAVGHTASDQAETVLHRMVRGTGIRGLAGMAYRTGSLVRPLLGISRKEILAYLQAEKLPFREDATNHDLRFTRNMIRHEILPLLGARLNPRVEEALNRLAMIAGETEAALDHLAEEALHKAVLYRDAQKIILDIHRISSYFSALQKYIIRKGLEEVSEGAVQPDFVDLQQIERLLTRHVIGKRYRFPGNWEVLIDHDGVVLWKNQPVAFDEFLRGSSGRVQVGKSILEWKRLSSKELSPGFQGLAPSTVFIDADRVAGTLRVRTPRRGDRFRPLGLNGSKSLGDYFTDRKIPHHQRPEVPVVVCDRGIIWVVGMHLDARFKLTSRTTSLLQLTYRVASS